MRSPCRFSIVELSLGLIARLCWRSDQELESQGDRTTVGCSLGYTYSINSCILESKPDHLAAEVLHNLVVLVGDTVVVVVVVVGNRLAAKNQLVFVSNMIFIYKVSFDEHIHIPDFAGTVAVAKQGIVNTAVDILYKLPELEVEAYYTPVDMAAMEDTD